MATLLLWLWNIARKLSRPPLFASKTDQPSRVNARGLMSGILQQGYSLGYVFAACANLGVGGEVESWKTVFWIAGEKCSYAFEKRERKKKKKKKKKFRTDTLHSWYFHWRGPCSRLFPRVSAVSRSQKGWQRECQRIRVLERDQGHAGQGMAHVCLLHLSHDMGKCSRPLYGTDHALTQFPSFHSSTSIPTPLKIHTPHS